jgi:transposase
LSKHTTPGFIGAFGQLPRSQKVSLLPSLPSMRVWSAARSIAGLSAIFERAPSALADGKRSGRPRTTPALTDAKLRQLLTSDPCQFGYDANTWTVPLLATHLHTQGVVISARTLRRRIHAARFRWKRPRYVYSERAEHVGAKKGALSDG